MLAQTQTPTAASGTDPRWQALLARDPAADGTFVFSVASTGVYCRPSCRSRRARPENVRFHATPAEAERAGFRACLRCRPTEATAAERDAAVVASLCRFIEGADEAPGLDDLAAQSGLSPSHLHRLFRSVTGLTPGAYARAARAERMRRELAKPQTVTEAIYGAGFASSGRFYEAANEVLGMTPGEFRRGGAGEIIRCAVAPCSLGLVLAAASSRGVCAILLGDEAGALAAELRGRFPKAVIEEDSQDLAGTLEAVVALVEQPRRGLALPLDLRGTVFQRRVWQALAAIPAGRTATYTEIAEAIGEPGAVRAVAGACAANPAAVAIPCHRVLRRDGSLSGYRWGVERKRALLGREAVPADG